MIVCTIERIMFHIYNKDVLSIIKMYFLGNIKCISFAPPTPARGHFTIDTMWFLIVFF